MPTRVYQLAKQLGVSSKELMDQLKEKGIQVKNHFESVEDDMALSFFPDGKMPAIATEPKPKKKAKKKKTTKKAKKARKTRSATPKVSPISLNGPKTPFEERLEKIELVLNETESLSEKIRNVLARRKNQIEKIRRAMQAKEDAEAAAAADAEAAAKAETETPAPVQPVAEEPPELKEIPRAVLEEIREQAEQIPSITAKDEEVEEVTEAEAPPVSPAPETPAAAEPKPEPKVEAAPPEKVEETKAEAPAPPKAPEVKPRKGKKRRIITMDTRLGGPKPLITKPATPLKQRRPLRPSKPPSDKGGGGPFQPSFDPQAGKPPTGDKGGKRKQQDKKSKTRFFPDARKQKWRDDTGHMDESLLRHKQRMLQKKTQRPEKLDIPLPITVKEFSSLSGIRQAEIIKFFFMKSKMLKANSHLQEDALDELSIEYEIDITIQQEIDLEEPLRVIEEQKDDEKDLIPRPPVVTFLGHVDHGKTSILDKIRDSNVQSKEFGGITQHISAYNIQLDDYSVTFVDTPGHAAFSQMRARGANVTDIVVLVVAADDGPMPQTEEAISHALAADVSIIAAINKTDLPSANIPMTKQRLADLNIIPPEWGGNVEMVEVSAMTGAGIDELLETIHLVGEVRGLKANPKRDAYGVVLEGRASGSRGNVVNLMVKNGTLKLGDYVVCGHTHGRIRGMWTTGTHEAIEEAGPSIPVEVIGLSGVPDASEKFYVLQDQQQAASLADERLHRMRELERADREKEAPSSIEQFMERLKEAQDEKELRIVLKADVKGSVEAIEAQIMELGTDEVKVKMLRAGVGLISEGDVVLAEASKGIVLGFNVSIDDRARSMAEDRKVHYRIYNVIYELLEEVRVGLEDRLAPVYEDQVKGHAEVRQIFKSSKLGNICGCFIRDGLVQRNSQMRLIRDGEVIHTGAINSLRRNQDNAKEVKEGLECGIKLEKYEDVREGDIIECFRTVAKRRTL